MEENPSVAAGSQKTPLNNDDQLSSENPKAKRVFNTKGFKKRKAIGRHKSGKQKSRRTIGLPAER